MLPLDSPAWAELTACSHVHDGADHLRAIVSTGWFGEDWDYLRNQMLHQGSVYGITSEALPYLVEIAGREDPAAAVDVWVDLAFMVVAGADRFPEPVPLPGLQAGPVSATQTR